MAGIPDHVKTARAAIKKLGGATALGKRYNTSRQRIEQWEKKGVPAKAIRMVAEDSGIDVIDFLPKTRSLASKEVPALQKPRNRG